jgi:cell division protease FtsH
MFHTHLIFVIWSVFSLSSNSFLINKIMDKNTYVLNKAIKDYYNPYNKKQREIMNKNKTIKEIPKKNYGITNPIFLEKIRRLNSKNSTIQNNAILDQDELDEDELDEHDESKPTLHIIFKKPSNFLESLGIELDEDNQYQNADNQETTWDRRQYNDSPNKKSQNFEVIKKFNIFFKDVGGYENVKEELRQCLDILNNYEKYAKYNVRIPKGLVLEGPPGTGKTLMAKSLAGEAGCSFIPLSGADFQEKYVGVGPTRVKELFRLAKQNVPCIIFIDEIDAVGRKRSSDGESATNERDSTLNALLVELDGFKNNSGIFLVAATNRADLLDAALTRPGRIDKNIYIGLPDTSTRKAIIDIHIKGKPHSDSIDISKMVEMTEGFSGAQIENLLNEAMLNALKFNNTYFTNSDFELIMNKMMVGWQPNEHEFTTDVIDRIAIHEMGHAVLGLLSEHHAKVSKVIINLFSPKSPGYTVFEGSTSNIYIREALFEHLMILLGGRIAEELFYNVSVTTGAINDFEEALKLANNMITYYGMGSNVIYPNSSEKYKELIDIEVAQLINEAYNQASIIIKSSKEFIYETAEILKRDKIIEAVALNELINTKYLYLKA